MSFKLRVFIIGLLLFASCKDELNMIDNGRNTANSGEIEVRNEILHQNKPYYEFTNCFAVCRSEMDVYKQLQFSKSQYPDTPDVIDFSKYSLIFASGFNTEEISSEVQVFTYMNFRKNKFRIELRMDSYYSSAGNLSYGYYLWIKVPKIPDDYSIEVTRLGFKCNN